jgi:hypothetical protein
MAQTQRRPVPCRDSGELDTAVAFLDFNRESVLKKTGGLDEEQLRRVLVPTGTNLLGLVKHLAAAERYWFGRYLTGRTPPAGSMLGMRVPPGTYRRGGDQRLPRGDRREQHGGHRGR